MADVVSREQVLAYRIWAQGVQRDVSDPAALPILDLGVQDSNVQSARVAIAIRLKDADRGRLREIDGDAFTVLWSHRASPHLHRTADLSGLAAALWPVSERDAALRLAQRGKEIRDAGQSVLAAWELATEAMRAVVTQPTTKGEASAAMTARLPDHLSAYCAGCGSIHLFDSLMRVAGLPAGVALRRERRGPALELEPIAGWERVTPSREATTAMVRAYLTQHGPANPIDVAAFIGTNRSELTSAGLWPDDMREVQINAKTASIPEDRYEALIEAPPPPHVRLLPPWDPLLQARERTLLVPEPARQKAVWKTISSPGALMVDGEIVGTWRAQKSGTQRLDITVSPFGSLQPDTRRDLDVEARIVAQARDADDVRLTIAAPA